MNQTELLNRLAFGAMLVGYFLNLVWMIDSDLTQASAVEGEVIPRLSQPGLVRREADKLARLSSNVGSVHHHHLLPALQHL